MNVSAAWGLGGLMMLTIACGSDPPPAEDTGSSGTTGLASSGTNESQTGAVPPATTTTIPPTAEDTTYGAGCGPNPCGLCNAGCEAYDLCIASEWSCECICESTTTGGADICDSLDAALLLWIESSINPPTDCGRVDLDDDAAAWQEVHDCVAAAARGASFHAAWSNPDLAPAPWEFGAANRFTDGPEQIWYEVSGVFTLTEYACTQIIVTPECVVDVGEMCIECERPVEVAVHCTDE